METIDRIYWTRAGTAVVAAAVASSAFALSGDGETGVMIAILFYLASYYFTKRVLKIEVDPTAKITPNTLMFQGIGTYVILFLFTWLLLSNLLFV